MKSDLISIKELAIAFLYQDVEETEYSPIVVQHPIFESAIYVLNENTQMINILDGEDNLRKAQEQIKNLILSTSDVWGVYMIIRKSYRMTFLKYANDYLSAEDRGKLLAHAWTSSENPNDDVNVPLHIAVKWFESADKTALMEEEEYKVYQSLPDTFEIYRGVAVGRNPKGLSWTRNLKTAKWFANRFNKEHEKGYVQYATIDKSQALAYFNSRNEDEIVVDTSKLNVKILK